MLFPLTRTKSRPLLKGKEQQTTPMPVACMELHGEGFGVVFLYDDT